MPKPAPAPVINEIVERGFVPSPEEYEFISAAIMISAEAAAKSGQPHVRTRLRGILGRLSHVVQAPGGLKPEQIQRFRTRAEAGLRERDSAKLAGGVQDLIAATLRTDPDPADKVAFYLLQLVAELMAEHRNMGVALLQRLDGELAGAQTAWNETGWPPTREAVGWIRAAIEVGIENLQADRDPWPSDEDDVEDESDEDAEEDGDGTDA